MNAGDVKEALHRRYNNPSQGRPGERWVCLEEARSGAGFSGNNGQCDFLAINTWQSRGMELVGHEIKVSKSDWAAELANPEKAERFARYCNRWYIAMPAELAKAVKHEVPPAWGLLSVSEKRVTELQASEKRKPEPVPEWWWVGWLAQIDRQHKRRLPALVEQGMADERETLRERIEADIEPRRLYADDQAKTLRENVDRFRAATGIDLRHAWPKSITQLGELWRLTSTGLDFGAVASHLRQAADKLDALRRGAS